MFGGPWTPSVCPSSSVAVELETVMANFVVHQTGVPVWQQGLGTDRKSYTEYSVHAWHGVRASRVLSAAVAGLPRKQPRRSSFQLCRPMEATRMQDHVRFKAPTPSSPITLFHRARAMPKTRTMRQKSASDAVPKYAVSPTPSHSPGSAEISRENGAAPRMSPNWLLSRREYSPFTL